MARVYNARMPSMNLTDHFLIAMPNMVDPHFSRTLTYVCEHNDQGALGLPFGGVAENVERRATQEAEARQHSHRDLHP